MEVSGEDKNYAYTVHFRRSSEDSFKYDVTKPSQPVSDTILSKKDLRVILPSGSDWRPSGWHSFFVLPLSKGNSQWTAVGHEVIRSHSSRGAYPELKALVYKDTKRVHRKIKYILKNLSKKESRKSKKILRAGFIDNISADLEAPYGLSMDILKEFLDRLNKYPRKRLLVRTCILSEYHLNILDSVDTWSFSVSDFFAETKENRLSIEYDTYLMWCPEDVYISFGKKEKTMIDERLNAIVVPR